MDEQPSAEDILIKRILIGSAVAAIVGLLALAGLVAVMVSYNFNFLEWME